MYYARQTLAHIDAHMWEIITLNAVAMAFNYVWFFSAYRQARRDAVYSVPILCTLFWFAGDASMVWRYDLWFNVYDHWYVKLFWLALVFTVAFEIAFVGQAIRYGRDELAPWMSESAFAALILAGLVATIVVWVEMKNALGDPLYIVYFHIANAAMPLLYPALLLRRRSRAGTSMLIWWAYLGMQMCGFAAAVLWFGPAFRGPETIAIWAVTTAGCIWMLYALSRLPKYEPAAGGAEAPPSVATPKAGARGVPA